MAKSYSNVSRALSFQPMPRSTYIAIGRMTRAAGDVENALIFYHMSMTGQSEADAHKELGRRTLTQRVKHCRKLAPPNTPPRIEFDNLFNDGWNSFVLTRNVVTHGRYVGVTEHGKFCFMVSNNLIDPKNSEPGFECVTHTHNSLAQWGRWGVTFSQHMREALQLGPLLEKHLPQALLPHPKARTPRQK